MITAQLTQSVKALANRLAHTAEKIAAAHLRTMALRKLRGGQQWREARLLWPQFNKER